MTCVNYQLLRKGYQLSQKKKNFYILMIQIQKFSKHVLIDSHLSSSLTSLYYLQLTTYHLDNCEIFYKIVLFLDLLFLFLGK